MYEIEISRSQFCGSDAGVPQGSIHGPFVVWGFVSIIPKCYIELWLQRYADDKKQDTYNVFECDDEGGAVQEFEAGCWSKDNQDHCTNPSVLFEVFKDCEGFLEHKFRKKCTDNKVLSSLIWGPVI